MFVGHCGTARGSRQAVTVPLPPSVEAVESLAVPDSEAARQFVMPLRLSSRQWLTDRRPRLTCRERAGPSGLRLSESCQPEPECQ